jgi:non-ribosomal peptide synthetase component F
LQSFAKSSSAPTTTANCSNAERKPHEQLRHATRSFDADRGNDDGRSADDPLDIRARRAQQLARGRRAARRRYDFRYTYADFGKRVAQLAHALVELGIKPGDRVATFAWNTHRHLELYYAVPMIGAVLHTVNIRLFPEQVAWVFEHAGDKLVFVDASLAPAVARACVMEPEKKPPMVTMGATDALPDALDYETLLAGRPDTFDVARARRTQRRDPVLHLGDDRRSERRRLHASLDDAARPSRRPVPIARHRAARHRLAVVPMFHVNAWGIPFLAPLVGAKLVLPGPKLDPASVIELVEPKAVTMSLGVPTVWLAVRDAAREERRLPADARRLVIGGSAVPPVAVRRSREAEDHDDPRLGHDRDEPDRYGLARGGRTRRRAAEVKREKLLKQGRFAADRRLEAARRRRQRGAARREVGRRSVGARPGGYRRVLSASAATCRASETATFTPATFARWTSTATCSSSTVPRIWSNRAASGSRASISRTP